MGVAVSVSLRLLLLRVSVLRVSAILASKSRTRGSRAGLERSPAVCGILPRRPPSPSVFAAMAAVLVAASLFVAVCVRAPEARRRRDGRLTLSCFRKSEGHGSPRAPEPARREAVPEDASVAAPALMSGNLSAAHHLCKIRETRTKFLNC